MATKAFLDQTSLGWDQFFRGRLSITWHKALYFSRQSDKSDTSDTVLKRLIKWIFTFSLEMWEHRNGILHGVTLEAQRRKHRETVIRQVEEVFQLYHRDPSIVLPQDRYLFTRQTKSQRLKKDIDTLMGWLRIVEVAMRANASFIDRARQQADSFFYHFA